MTQPSLRGTIESLTLVALGSNADSPHGDARATVEAAVAALRAAFGDGVAVSRFFATPAFPAGSGPDFVNAAAAFHSASAPGDILARLHEIEAAFGRSRGARWGQRSLDLDLIAVGDLSPAGCRHADPLARSASVRAAEDSPRGPDPAASAAAGPGLRSGAPGGCGRAMAPPATGPDRRPDARGAPCGRDRGGSAALAAPESPCQTAVKALCHPFDRRPDRPIGVPAWPA